MPSQLSESASTLLSAALERTECDYKINLSSGLFSGRGAYYTPEDVVERLQKEVVIAQARLDSYKTGLGLRRVLDQIMPGWKILDFEEYGWIGNFVSNSQEEWANERLEHNHRRVRAL